MFTLKMCKKGILYMAKITEWKSGRYLTYLTKEYLSGVVQYIINRKGEKTIYTFATHSRFSIELTTLGFLYQFVCFDSNDIQKPVKLHFYLYLSNLNVKI